MPKEFCCGAHQAECVMKPDGSGEGLVGIDCRKRDCRKRPPRKETTLVSSVGIEMHATNTHGELIPWESVPPVDQLYAIEATVAPHIYVFRKECEEGK